MRRYNCSYRGYFSRESSESLSQDGEGENLNRSEYQNSLVLPVENMEFKISDDHGERDDYINDNVDSEVSEIESELNPTTYIFMPHSRWNKELIVIASLLYACVMKSISEDGLNCILSILMANLGLTNIPHTLSSLKRRFKQKVINYPQHTDIQSYCYNCRAVSVLTRGRSTPRCNDFLAKLSLFVNFDFFFQLRMILSNNLECLRDNTEFLATSDMDNGDILYGSHSLKQTNNQEVQNIHLLVSADGGNPYVTLSCSYWPITGII